jgi:hypothetical protein
MSLACPFSRVASASVNPNRAAHAKTLAMAFAAAHTMEDVFAALRFEARRSGEPNLYAYLDGALFNGYHETESNFEGLRDLAHVYLETV